LGETWGEGGMEGGKEVGFGGGGKGV